MTADRSPFRRSPAWRRITVTAAVLPLLALAAACGYGSKATKDTAPAAAAPTTNKKLSASTVRIGYFANLTHATPLIGIQEGLFQKELGTGTKVEPQVVNAGPAEIEALNAGSIDIGWIGPSPAINGFIKSSGKSLKIISGSASGGAKFVVNPKKIKSLNGLKGKRIATPQLGNTQDVALLNYLTTHGYKVDPTTGKGDVTVQRIDNKLTPTAYAAGDIDGAWVPEPTASKLVAEGAKVLLDESSLWPQGKFVTTNVIVSQQFLKAHPDVVEAVLRGSVATNAWINANPDKAKTAANAALKTLSGKALPADVLDPAWKSITATDDPLAATLREEADHATKAGLLKKVSLKGIYDLSILNKVLKSEGKSEVSDAGLGN